jgi:hypothetical protein
MEEKKRRGRPKKINFEEPTSIPQSMNNEIDNTKFDFAPSSGSSEQEISSGFNPLGDSVIERDYSAPKLADGIVGDLEEPVFRKESFQDIENKANATTTNADGQPSNAYKESIANDPLTNVNPVINELDDKEKRASSEALVDTVLDVYDSLHQFGANAVKFSEDEMRKLILEGKIDPNRLVTVDETGSQVTISQFVSEFNAQVDETIAPDPSFRKKVAPVMVRVFMKRGWGMTDEQYLMALFGKDAFSKAAMGIGLRKSINLVISTLVDEKESQRLEQEMASMPPKPAPKPTPSPAQQAKYESVVVEDMDNVIDEMESEDNYEEPEDSGTDKLHINVEENPLRQKRKKRDLSKNVKVKTSFTKGKPINPI